MSKYAQGEASECATASGASGSESGSSVGCAPADGGSVGHFARRNPGWHFVVVSSSFTLAIPYAPYTLGAAGWAWGSLCWLYSIAMTWWSGVLIGRCVLDGSKRGVPSTYPDMMRDAFGFPGYCFGAIMQIATYYMMNVGLFVGIANWALLSQSVLEVESGPGSLHLCLWQWIVVAGVVATLLAQIKTFRSTMPLAIVSLLTTLVRQGIMYYQIGSHDLISQCTPRYGGATPQSGFIALAVCSWLFGGHGFFPEEIRELRRPQSYFKALHVTYVIMIVVYLSNTYVAYTVWGDFVTDDIQFNWPLNTATLVSALMSVVWGLISTETSHVMLLAQLEERLKVSMLDDALPKWAARLARFLFRSLVVWSEVFFALMLSGAGIANIQALVGAVGLSALCFYAPVLAYWKLLGRKEPLRWQLLYLVATLSGVALMVTGLYSSVVGMAGELSTYTLFDTTRCASDDILNVMSCSNPCHEAYGGNTTCLPVA